MKTITITHQKGGVGKTTIALNLAYAFTSQLKVGFLDADPQRSAQNISEIIEDKSITFITPEEFKGNLTFDILIIDTPPYLSNVLTDYLQVSDVVIIPTQVSYLDFIAISGTVALVKKAQKTNPNLKAAILLNMVTKSNFKRDIEDILLQQAQGLPIFETEIVHRISYKRSSLQGGVFETEDEKAKQEILNLIAEIQEML